MSSYLRRVLDEPIRNGAQRSRIATAPPAAMFYTPATAKASIRKVIWSDTLDCSRPMPLMGIANSISLAEVQVRSWRQGAGFMLGARSSPWLILRRTLASSDIRNWVFPQTACCSGGHDANKTRARSSSKPALPYMARFSILSLLI